MNRTVLEQALRYPNPLFQRDGFTSLNGEWDFAFDGEEIPTSFDRKIKVPFSYETKASGIGEEKMHTDVWYHRSFSYAPKKRTLLRFGAVDYNCFIFLNGQLVGSHVGGFTSFYFDVTNLILPGTNDLVIHVQDSFSGSQLRGKQRQKNENYLCWYTQTTGIWRDVYLESVGEEYLETASFIGNDKGDINYCLEANKSCSILLKIEDPEGKLVLTKDISFPENAKGVLHLGNYELWDEEHPNIYTVILDVHGDSSPVKTEFGFRSVSVSNSRILINGKATFLRMVLEQGYYPTSGLTPLSKEDVIKDFDLIKQLGFNGTRIHQKSADPLFYYLADHCGLYLWSEMPSTYSYDEKMKREVKRDFPILIQEKINCPSIIAYVLFNESWGVKDIGHDIKVQSFVDSVKKSLEEVDSSRLFITNDGWNQTKETDILSLHEYEQDPKKLQKEFTDVSNLTGGGTINGFGPAFASFSSYNGQPIVLSEFGGVSLASSKGWGYGDKAIDISEYKKRLSSLFSAVYLCQCLSGFCYTQLSDVEQESNGLVDSRRNPKLPLNIIASMVKGEKSNE